MDMIPSLGVTLGRMSDMTPNLASLKMSQGLSWNSSNLSDMENDIVEGRLAENLVRISRRRYNLVHGVGDMYSPMIGIVLITSGVPKQTFRLTAVTRH
jgi:hypothetical protein